MKMNLLGVAAVLSCVCMADAVANRSSMYSNISMRNSEGDTIKITRGTSESSDRGYRHYKSYNNDAEPRRYQRVDKSEYASKQTYTKGETYRKTAKRKYFIANPFYQPLQGQVGSVTTGEYLEGKYNFGGVDRKLTEWSLKEDLSYGLTDRIALQGMAKYNADKLIWKDSIGGGKNEYKSNGLNVYGLGLQGRIIDTDKWISTLSGYYEHQKHGVDYFIGDFKAGYKVATSTIYGLLRGWVVNMEGDIYGEYMDDVNATPADWAMLVYGDSDDTLFMGEVGMGVWTVIAEDWTLNLEGMYGMYDWHNQLSIKGAFGWQPNDYFALNLYAKTSLYDSANKKSLDLVSEELPFDANSWNTAWNTAWNDSTSHGHAVVDISKYREWSVGLQVMFQF